MSQKISFEEMIQTAALEAINRSLDDLPSELFTPSTPSEEEQSLMKQLLEAKKRKNRTSC